MNRASVFEWHQRFKEGRESVRDDERCGRSEEVNTSELIVQRVRVRVTMLRFYGVQEDIPSEEASTLEIGSVEFPPGHYTSPRLHPCRYGTIEEMKEAVMKVIDMLTQEDLNGAFQKLFGTVQVHQKID